MNINEKAQLRSDIERLIKNRESILAKSKRRNLEVEEELNIFKKIYDNYLKSEFQIVLFKIDTTGKDIQTDDEKETTYIIYDVELNNVYEIKKHGNERDFTPEDIDDYTELFADIGMKFNIWEAYPIKEEDYVNMVSRSIVLFKKIIEEIKSKYDCNTWEDLRGALGHEIFMRDAYKFHIINNKDLSLRINPYR